jgi:hypothetical protein
MAQVGSVVKDKVIGLLTGASGLPLQLGQISQSSGVQLPPIPPAQVLAQNVAAELAERSAKVPYPVMYVYTTRVENQLREKFRTFSGVVEIVMEVRVTNEHLDDLERDLQLYLDATTSVLDGNRGDWGGGMFFGGRYEISIGPAKPGGRYYVQVAKVKCEVDMSLK